MKYCANIGKDDKIMKFKENQEKLNKIFKKNQVILAYLFGSAARGKTGPLSDIDIAYSLGNFVFDQGFSEETTKGLLLKVIIRDSKIKEVIPVGIKINRYFQPEIVGNVKKY